MRKWLAAIAVLGLCVAPLGADVTVTQTMTMEGAAAAMMPPGQMPKMVMRIKGMKSRADIDAGGQVVSAITDLAARQVIMLMPGTKVAQVITPETVAAGGAPLAMPAVDVTLTPTGKSQTIDGLACDEHAFSLAVDMAAMGGGEMPPEARAAMKDVTMKMDGSIWIAKAAPGTAEWVAFYKAAADSKLLTAISGMKPGQPGGLDKLFAATAAAPGIPYLTEMTMRFEGTGPMVEAMNKMGVMKIVQRVTSVSTEPIADTLFAVPEGYTVK